MWTELDAARGAVLIRRGKSGGAPRTAGPIDEDTLVYRIGFHAAGTDG
jgi:hypothetical protein